MEYTTSQEMSQHISPITCIKIYFERKLLEPTYDISKADNPDALCTTTSYESIARINITDKYRLKGGNYYILSFESIVTHSDHNYKSPEFVLSETEYNNYFGAGNDAFTTTVYGLRCETTVLTYRNNVSIYSCEVDVSDKKWGDSKIYIGMCKNQETHKGYLYAYRFSVFGEQNFTDNEIEKAKELLISVCKNYVLSTPNPCHRDYKYDI